MQFNETIARLRDGIVAAGLPAPSTTLKLDGTFNRWGVNGSKPCWLIAHVLSSGHVAASFGDWRTGSCTTYRSWENGHAIDPNEAQRLLDESARRQKLADETTARAKAATAKCEAEIWAFLPESGKSAYLERKGVGAYGIRYGADQYGCFIAIPMRTVDGKLTAFQRIYDDGRKHFPKGSEKKGTYHLIGALDTDDLLYLAEGYATGATVHEATSKPVAVCFDAGNLKRVADTFKSIHPDLQLIVAADNDQWKADELDDQGRKKGNTGVKAAFAVARAHPGTKIAIPNFDNLEFEVKDGKGPSDFNDLAALAGLENVARQLEKAFEPKKGKDTTEHTQSQVSDPTIQFKVTSKGTPKAIVFNVLQVFRYDPRWQGVFGHNEFAECAMLLKRPPYDHRGGDWTPRALQDSDDIEAADWMQGEFDLPVSSGMVAEAIQVAARYNPYHPVKDYLNPLKWDGTSRLDTWLNRYFGVVDSDYTRAVSSKALIAAIARIYRPGCKADTVPILDGPQGYLKSTAWRVLAGDEWFTDHMPDLHSKDAMQQLQGKWIIELAELSALNRSDIEATKRFLSAVQDDFRPSYGRRRITLPRQCIFVGTTNETCYLKDSTGNRRFWPVSITKRCDISRLKDERNQLWAEAVHRFTQGERWHLTGELEQQAAEEQSARIEPDEWEPPIMAYLQARSDIFFITTGEILEAVLGIEKKDWVFIAQKRVSSILKCNGWKHTKKRIDGVQTKGFLRPIPQPPASPEPPHSGQSGTDGTDAYNYGTGRGITENSNKINAGTAGTAGTGIYRDTKQVNTQSSYDNSEIIYPYATLRIIESTGTASTSGTTLEPVDYINVLGGIAGTGIAGTGTTEATGTGTSPPDLGADYGTSLVSASETAEPVTGQQTGTAPPLGHESIKLSTPVKALQTLLAEYKGWESLERLAKRLRWHGPEGVTKALLAAQELQKHGFAKVAGTQVKPVQEGRS
jgi:putative DNA primase/helicase